MMMMMMMMMMISAVCFQSLFAKCGLQQQRGNVVKNGSQRELKE